MTQWIREGRPSIHFAPQKGWINDPNGLVYDGKHYHLFAQHNPHDAVWGPMHWLHAVSEDLLHWKELGIALCPDALGTMFSGSAVIDEHNTAGFGSHAMIAMFTQHGSQETQGIAYALDGQHFTVFAGNPVIPNPGIPDFRDPKVFWHKGSQSWCMVLAAGSCLAFYRSHNLKHWHKTGEFGAGEKGPAGVYECSDVFPLATPDGREKWVLMASIGAPPQHGGERIHYFLGEYDGQVFRQTEAMGQLLRVDTGADNYAGVTFNGTEDRLFMGWAAAPVYAGRVPAGSYRGCLTLPRRLSLAQTKAGLRLAAQPVLPRLAYQPLNKTGALPPSAYVLGLQCQGAFEAQLCNPNGEVFRFGLDGAGNLYTDRAKAGISDFWAGFATPQYSGTSIPRVLEGPMEMTLVVDHTLAELYGDKGTYVHTTLLFPTTPYTHLRCRGAVDVQVAAIAAGSCIPPTGGL